MDCHQIATKMLAKSNGLLLAFIHFCEISDTVDYMCVFGINYE
jgi:hypothetical protein